MDELELLSVSEEFADAIKEYRAEFPDDRMRVTLDPERIPGLDHLESFDNVYDWLEYCHSMEGKLSWYVTLRKSDGRMIGAFCLRHRLEYDDDDIDFASHIGYSIRPSERRKGYAKEQLRLALIKAGELGIKRVRIVCLDTNEGSNRTIIANGGVLEGSITGDLSGLTINRYDIML